MSTENQDFFQNMDINQAPSDNAVLQPSPKQEHIADPTLRDYVHKTTQMHFTLSLLPELAQNLFSEDVFQRHYGVIGIRKVLSVEKPPVQEVINAHVVPRLVEFMKLGEFPHLQLESAWALTNVASGTSTQTQTIIDFGGIPLFVDLLKSKYPIVAEQALWAIGNIAGDST